MVESIDLKSINHKVKGDTAPKPLYSSSFDPIRRKMHVAIPE